MKRGHAGPQHVRSCRVHHVEALALQDVDGQAHERIHHQERREAERVRAPDHRHAVPRRGRKHGVALGSGKHGEMVAPRRERFAQARHAALRASLLVQLRDDQRDPHGDRREAASSPCRATALRRMATCLRSVTS